MQPTSAIDPASLADEQAALRRVATLVARGAPPNEVLDAVAVEVGGLIGADLAVLSRYEQDGGVTIVASRRDGTTPALPLTSQPTVDPESLTAAVLRTGRPARIEDFAEAPGSWAREAHKLGHRSAVGAPVMVGGRLWGVMLVISTNARAWPPDTEDRLAAFTDLLATAIANAESLGELAASEARTRALAEEQAALRRVATLVAEGAAAHDLFAAVAREVADLFGVGMVNIDRYENGESVVVASVDNPGFPVGSRWPLDGPGVRAIVYETGHTARVDDFAGIAGTAPAAARAWGIKSAVAVPIVVDGEVWGVLGFGWKEDEPLPADTEQRLAAFTELVGTAIANAKSRGELAASEARARELAEEQAALRRVATLVARGVQPLELFSAVSEEVGRVFGSHYAGVVRFEPDGSGAAILGVSEGGRNIPIGTEWPFEDFLTPTEVYGNPDSVTAAVLRTGRPARVDDYADASGSWAAEARELGYRSGIGVPVTVQGRLWGVMIVTSAEAHHWPPDTEDRLAAFTELLATAIANAESRAELADSEVRARALADEQAALRRVATLVAEGAPPNEVLDAVAVEVGRLIGGDLAVLSRYEQGGGVTVLSSRPEGTAREPPFAAPTIDPESLTAAVLRTGRPARIDDFGEAPGPWSAKALELGRRSAVAAPLTVQGSLWGVMAVISTEAHAWPHDTEDRLAAFTELLATAIANAESRGELAASEAQARALAEEQAALRRVATTVAQGAPPDDLFSAVAKEVAGVLDIPTVAINRYEADGTLTILGITGETSLWIGTRWPVWGVAEMTLASGQPSRLDDFKGMPAQFGDPVRDALTESWQEPRSVVGVPIIVEGSIWGLMSAAAEPGPPLPAGTEERLSRFNELLATAIANAESRSELAASEARARVLANEQTALRRVATLVAKGATPDRVFDAVRHEVARMFNIPSTVLMRFDADGMGTLLATYGDYLGPVGTRWPLEGDTSAVAKVHQTGRAARANYTDTQHVRGSLAQAARRGGVRYPVAVPVVVEGALWGAMSAGSYGPAPPPADLERRLAEFTELLATAIANAESRADLAASEARARELAEEQAALRRVATLVARGVRPRELFSAVSEEVGRVFGSHYSGVGRFELDGSGVVIVGVSEGIRNIPIGTRWPLEEFLATTAVYRTGRPARNDRSDWEDASSPAADSLRELGLVSTVAAPIVVEGNVWGVVTVSDAHQRLPPDAEERLAAFTELVATAIANAESRAELAASEARARELANEQAALRRVATLVAQGAGPDELFSAVAREVAAIVDVPIVGIHRYEAEASVTTVGIVGETSLTVGTRLRVTEEGIAAMMLSTGQPARIDDYTNVPPDAVREDLRIPMVGVPIVVEGSIWGFMVAVDTAGPLRSDTEDRLVRFTELVATAVSNATTRGELLASRARVVSAADETRRRLERDLHDGIQQWLVALALRARKAAGLSGAADSAVQELTGLADDLVAVTDELREISRGIHPAILSDAGLDEALKALARRSAIAVDVEVAFQRRYDPTLEATVYYVAAESITNAVKHAHASTITVRGGRRNGSIELEISDDGIGGADPHRGTGLIGLKDRVDTLGGTISFASPTGAGTTIRVTLPAGARGDTPPSG